MKIAFFLAGLFYSLRLFAQADETIPPFTPDIKVTVFSTYGYVGGTRLDSLASTYATYDGTSSDEMTFDYGQTKKKRRDMVITDSKGQVFRFPNISEAFMLNFFHYNHWDYVNSLQTPYAVNKAYSYTVLKKQL